MKQLTFDLDLCGKDTEEPPPENEEACVVIAHTRGGAFDTIYSSYTILPIAKKYWHKTYARLEVIPLSKYNEQQHTRNLDYRQRCESL